MKIVLATDGSADAEYAAQFLSRIPHHEPMELTVVTTVFIPEVAASSASDSWLPEFKQEQQDTVLEHFEHIKTMFEGADVELRHTIATGHVGHSITEAAEAAGADLIVLGAKGHSAVNRILLGSVSDFVATHATCSVLVVRRQEGDTAENIRVTIAHDGSTASDAALDQFALFKWGSSTAVHLLNVVPIVRTFRQDLFPEMVLERAKQREQAQISAERASERVKHVAPKIEPNVIESEHVGESIINFAEVQGSNLIVMGEHHRNPLARLMLGSVSRYVLRHAGCSVWISREKE